MSNTTFNPDAPDDVFVSQAQTAAIAAQTAQAAAVAAQVAAEAALASVQTVLSETPYDIASYINGTPGVNQGLMRFIAVRDFWLPVGLVASEAHSEVAATAAYSVDVQRNLVSIGSMNFALGATDATFVFAADVQFVAGDDLDLIAGPVPDLTLADMHFTLAANIGTI